MPASVAAAESDARASKFVSGSTMNAVTYPLKSDSKVPVHPPLSKPSLSVSRRQVKGLISFQRAFGLEIRPAEVTWRGWMPGEEYTKTITLKNTQIRTQKIRYKVPTTPLFSTIFPKVIVLSAGTSFTLPLTFKPLEKRHYEDKVEFTTSQGKLIISLKALLPETKLAMPESLRFGLAAAHDNLEVTFQLENMSSELVTSFSWDVPDPFSIHPPTGSIGPRGSCKLKAVFRPLSASVFETYAVCCYGEDNIQQKVLLEGIGKFPHLVVSAGENEEASSDDRTTSMLNFGGVEIHDTVVKSMVLQNLSNVRVPFKIQLVSFAPESDRVFTCSVKEGIAPASSKVNIPIRFKPTVVSPSCIDYFEVYPIGRESKSMIKCIGYCTGPVMKLQHSLLNFGLTQSGKEVVKTLNICNESTCEAIFQIMLDPLSSLWHVSESCGVLSKGETRTLYVSFTPSHPIPYYRRLTIMVHNQGPLFLDLIGTCHNLEHHPPLLKDLHLENYKVHAARGLTFYAPHVISQLLKEQKIKVDEGGYLTRMDEVDNKPIQRDPFHEYFDDAHNTEITQSPPHVSLDKQDVWFGKVEFNSDEGKSNHVSVRLTNHTRGKITVNWMQDYTRVFEVIPAVCDIPPLKVSDFRVVFYPTVPNQFFGAELECYCYYKSLRDFKLVDDLTTIPPWCLTLSVSGHTFSGINSTFLPQVELQSDRMSFPATCDNEASYRTMLVKNVGSTPHLYQFIQNPDSKEPPFTIKPSRGMSTSKYHISVCRLEPRKVEFYKSDVTLRLNDNKTHDMKISLTGTGEQPELLLTNDGDLYFQPTCIGSLCHSTYAVQNTGRIAINFFWKIPVTAHGTINVEPKQGVILPNEIQHHTWTFAPTAAETYLFKPACYTFPHSEPARNIQSIKDVPHAKRRKFILRIIGEGHYGDVKCEQPTVDLGSIICDKVSPQSLILRNTSTCDVRFRLTVEQSAKCPYGETNDENIPMALTLDKMTDMLPAQSRMAVTALVNPCRRAAYTWIIYYEIINGKEENNNPGEKIMLSELCADAVYPSLSVVDAQTFGSGSSISKTQLWRWFNLDSFNFALDADPDEQELIYSVSTRRSVARRPTVYTRSIMEFNFGAAPLDSETCYVNLLLKNTGAVPSEWSFLYPKDLQISMDYWAETGILDPDELHEAHIQDNKLFTVSPNKGLLLPGQSCTVLLQYKHDITGTHRIPVLFKVENGREILLNMVGVTVEPGRRYIHFPGSKHIFNPVAVGSPSPPKQLYEVYNGGSVSVMYEVNLAPLAELQNENFDHPVLTCLNPQGEVLPGTCNNIEFIFSPLEAKTYLVDIPIHIIGGDVALITISGIGYEAQKIGANTPTAIHTSEFSGVPKSRMIEMIGQNVFLSEESINFGNIPLFSRNRYIFFISNTSEEKAMRYSWHAASETVNDVLRIEPVSGRLLPGERLLTKITFCATGHPSFYDLDLICEVLDESKMEGYQLELISWEEEKARQEVEFAIYEEDLQEQLEKPTISRTSTKKENLENVLNKSLVPMKLSEPNFSPPRKSELKNYETLPPIRSENPLQLPSNRSRDVRKRLSDPDDGKWPQPLPPEPFVLHLGINACTHDISEFRTNYPQKGGTHFIDRMLQLSRPIPSRAASQGQPLLVKDEAEKDTVLFTLSKIIRGVLEDSTFHSLVRSIADEKTPYFQQLPCEEPGSVTNLQDDSIKDTEDKVVEVEESTTISTSEVTCEGQIEIKESQPEAASETNSVNTELEIKRSPFFGSLLEDILSSTISNIMTEAFKGEVVLTARPRLVALPPSSSKQEGSKTGKERRSSSNSSSRNSNSREKSRKSRSKNSSLHSQRSTETQIDK